MTFRTFLAVPVGRCAAKCAFSPARFVASVLPQLLLLLLFLLLIVLILSVSAPSKPCTLLLLSFLPLSTLAFAQPPLLPPILLLLTLLFKLGFGWNRHHLEQLACFFASPFSVSYPSTLHLFLSPSRSLTLTILNTWLLDGAALFLLTIYVPTITSSISTITSTTLPHTS